jgi:Flp pilus assembly pilin Flp
MALQGIRRFIADDRGASLWEYALLVIIGLGIFTALMALRDRIREVFEQATSDLNW